ncbi:hypothetical protein ACFX13_040475 [Malus domestica]
MDFSIATSKNSSKQTRTNNLSKQRLRRKLMSLSRDVRELKEATGKEVTFYVETKDKKLFCVTGQHRVEDMLAQHVAKVEVSDDQELSERKTLGQVVDHDKCDPQWIKPIKTMGEEELKLYKISLLEVKKGMEKATEQKSTAAGGSSGLTSDRDGSATATVSRERRCGLGQRRMRPGCE